MTHDLNGKIIMITGAGQGLGKTTALTLSRAGAQVLLADIKTEQVEAVADEIKKAGGRADAYALNVGDDKQVEEVMNRMRNKYSKLDGLINNAGVDVTKSIEELSADEWKRIIQVNLSGPFFVTKYALPILEKSEGSTVINITSTAAKRAWKNASAYHASKWGLLGLSYALFTEAREKRIKVTALVAGGMRTPFILERFPETDPSLLQDPKNVADVIHSIFTLPGETVIPEVMVLPLRETSWP